MSYLLLFCITADVYFYLSRGCRNGLALFTQLRLIGVFVFTIRMGQFTILNRHRQIYELVSFTILTSPCLEWILIPFWFLRLRPRYNLGPAIFFKDTRCQFHQHFTRNFFYESALRSFSLMTFWLRNSLLK
jgi:hypothetical protein